MRYLTGKLEDGRIRIKVGISPFQAYEPVEAVTPNFALNYTECTALVDTGARRTCVTESIVHKVGLKRKGRAEIWNIKRPETHWTYLFHVAIWPNSDDPQVPSAPFGIGPEIEGIDVGNNHFFDVLLGMDIISLGSFQLNMDGTFKFTFPG